MKTRFNLFGRVHVALAIISTSMLTHKAEAEMRYTNEYWISTNVVANTNDDIGTLDRPFDGSTAAKFDARLNWLPANSTLHILAGTYQTYGTAFVYGSNLKSGQKILGSGIDVTVLRFMFLTNTPDNCYVLANTLSATNIEVADLTADANYSGGNYTINGILLFGTKHAIRRVKVINCAHFGGSTESFGIFISGYLGGVSVESDGNIIEECEVSQFQGGTSVSAIAMGGYATHGLTGVIRNNRIFLPATNCCAYLGINGGYVHDWLIEGNYVEGATIAFYGDTGGTKNVIVAHNTFKNCDYGVGMQSAPVENMTIAFNTISLNTNGIAGGAAFAFELNSYYTNIVITGNNVGLDGLPKSGVYYQFLDANNVTGLRIDKNTIDSLVSGWPWSPYNPNDQKVGFFDNFDRRGNFIKTINQVEPPNSVVRTTVTNGAYYVVSYADRYIGVKNTNSGFIVYLPTPVGWHGKEFIIAKEISNGNDVWIVPSNGELINGASYVSFNSAYGSKTVISDGSNWFAR